MPATQPNAIFQKAAEMGASDVHIAVGVPVTFRVHDVLTSVTKGALTEADVKKIIHSVLGEAAYKQFERDREIDVSHTVGTLVRLRVNCHFERGVPSMAARIIPNAIPTLEEVGLGETFGQLLRLTEGSSSSRVLRAWENPHPWRP